MQTTSTDYKLEIKKPNRSFECKVTIGNNIYTNDDIVDIILETIQPGEGFSIGNTPSQTLDLTLLNRGDIIYSTSQVKVEIGLKIGVTIEYILMGYFNIDDIEKTDYTTKITAYDNMIKFETPYFSNLGDIPTLQQVVNELATKTGVQFTGSLPAYTVKKLEGFTCREILGYVSSLCGGNALITRDGKFTIVTPKNIDYSITPDNYIDYKREEVKYKIGKVSCKVGDKELNKGSLGTDSMEVKFENQWVTDSILNDIYTKLNGFEYLGYTMKWQGDISLDVGDTITCTDVKGVVRKIPIISQKFTYNGGLTAEIGAKGETKNKNSFNSSGSGSNKLDRVVTDLLIVNKALIDKANIQDLEAVSIRTQKLEAKTAEIEIAIIDVAHVSDLTAINANIEKLIAADATMGQAIIGKANIADLTAVNGKINILESSVGDIQTIINGNLTSDNIQSLILTSDKVTVVNGFIKNAMIENLDVSKILAGDISTNKFRIKSDNGGIEIVGATQQFKDKNNRVRIQMGQDALGNFNFILRGEDGTTTLIDHTGIKEKAIANDLIKGNMIAENAVGGKQVDYNSFTEEFNKDTNTHTLKSSKVLLDKNNQTLDIAFNSLSTTVQNIEVGGRNLMISSNDPTKIFNFSGTSGNKYIIEDSSISSKIIGKFVSTGTTNPSPLIYTGLKITAPNAVTKIEEYIFSCYIKANRIMGLNFTVNSANIISKNFTQVTTEWQYVKVIYKPASLDGANYNAHFIITGFNTNDEFYIHSAKIEKGNKATDWTPAPEDVDASISNVKEITTSNTTAINVQQGKISALISNTTIVKDGQNIQLKDAYNSTVATVDSISNVISSHTSNIDALTGQITGVETKTNEVRSDLDGTVATVSKHTASINGLNSTVNTQSSSISQLQNSIKVKVEETQVNNIVNGAIDGIEVGGRNLFILKNVGKYKASHNNIGDTANIVIENYTFNIIVNPSDLLGCTIYNIKDKLIISGETNLITLTPYYTFYNENGTVAQVQRSLTITVEDGKFKFILDVPPNAFKMEIGLGLYPYVSPYWLRNVKIEKGNKATDWTPAPEDTQEQITSVSKRTATIETNLTGITSRVSTVEQTTTTIDGKVTEMDTRLKAAEVKITDNAIISTVSSTINTAKNDAIELAKAISEGKMIYADATFTKGNNGLNVYNNSGGAHTTVTRIAKPSDCPTTSTHCIEVKTIGGTTSPGLGGCYFGNQTRANAVFVLKMIAKIPVGSKLFFASNSYGTGGSAKWLTSNAGTGQWEEYIHKVTCGSSGTFSTTNFFYIDKGNLPFTWQIASASIYDITDTTDLSIRIESAEQKITSDAIISSVNTAIGNGKSISTVSTRLDKNGFTIYNGAIDVRNKAGASVLKGDANGNLMVRGNLYADPANPILHLFGGCSLDATYNNEQGIGSSVRLKWDASNYIRISNSDIALYQGGIARYAFTSSELKVNTAVMYINDQCKIDCAGGTFRMYISKTVDTGIRVSPDGTIAFLVNGTSKHVFYPGGTKAGGTIEVDGATLGMSPIDSPKVLLEDVLFDIDIQEEGTTVVLDSTFLKTISTYAVFCSNHNVDIVSKDRTSFTVRGYTGKVDFRIIGYRIGYEEQYYNVVG